MHRPQLCCICFQKNVKLKFLNDISCRNLSLVKMVEEIVPEMVKFLRPDSLQACDGCTRRVDEMYVFRKTILENNRLLNGIVLENIGADHDGVILTEEVILKTEPMEAEPQKRTTEMHENFEEINIVIRTNRELEDCVENQESTQEIILERKISGTNRNEAENSNSHPDVLQESSPNQEASIGLNKEASGPSDRSTCNICQKTYRTSKGLSRHRWVHVKKRGKGVFESFKLCPTTFASLDELNKYLQSTNNV